MLYNPNNIAPEISPVTTPLELEGAGQLGGVIGAEPAPRGVQLWVAEQLARMIGYDPARHWGHITSGGTIANFEALWLARGVRYLPCAAAGAAAGLGLGVWGGLPEGGTG